MNTHAWRTLEIAVAARDVPPGADWTFRDHRTMAEVFADEEEARRVRGGGGER